MKTDLISRKAIVDMLQDAEDETFADAERTMNPIKAIASGIVEEIKNRVIAAPAVDAVQVVRCKDCKHAIVNENHIDKPLICCLTKMVGTTDEDWFCADGKRKMDGGATE